MRDELLALRNSRFLVTAISIARHRRPIRPNLLQVSVTDITQTWEIFVDRSLIWVTKRRVILTDDAISFFIEWIKVLDARTMV